MNLPRPTLKFKKHAKAIYSVLKEEALESGRRAAVLLRGFYGCNEVMSQNQLFPPACMEKIKVFYDEFSSEEVLAGCMHGYSQNVVECFNGQVWSAAPKTKYD